MNWGKVKADVYLKAYGAKNTRGAFPAITYAFTQLRNHHGVIARKDTFYRNAPAFDIEEKLSPAVKKEFLKGN